MVVGKREDEETLKEEREKKLPSLRAARHS